MWDYVVERRGLLTYQALQHLSLVLQCVLLGSLIAVALAVLVYRSPTATALANGVSAVGLTIPSFALLGILLAPFGFGITPAVIAVTFYAALPVLRNAVVGLAGVDSSLVESARGIGMSRTAVLLRIELPLAWPVVLAGVRTALVLLVGTAILATFIDGGGLGVLITTGINLSLNALLVSGAVLVALLALAVDWLGRVVEHVARPKGL